MVLAVCSSFTGAETTSRFTLRSFIAHAAWNTVYGAVRVGFGWLLVSYQVSYFRTGRVGYFYVDIKVPADRLGDVALEKYQRPKGAAVAALALRIMFLTFFLRFGTKPLGR